VKIIGTTTDGEIINGDITSFSTVLSFSIFEHTDIDVFETQIEESSYQSGYKILQNLSNKDNAKAAIVFADGLKTNGEMLLKAFGDVLPKLKVSGGLAGDNGTYVFTQNGIIKDGIVAAILYGKRLKVKTSFSFGWEEIGKELIVTDAFENTVYKIDNMTPTEIYNKYLGNDIGEHLPATGIEFPLILNRDGNQMARAVVGKNDDGSLVFAGNINKGDKVRLGYGNIENILEN
jgi:hypothetical protein